MIPSQITSIIKTTENNDDDKDKQDSFNYLFPENSTNYFTDYLKGKITVR